MHHNPDLMGSLLFISDIWADRRKENAQVWILKLMVAEFHLGTSIFRVLVSGMLPDCHSVMADRETRMVH